MKITISNSQFIKDYNEHYDVNFPFNSLSYFFDGEIHDVIFGKYKTKKYKINYKDNTIEIHTDKNPNELENFDDFIEIIKNNFNNCDYIFFWIPEWISIGILTNQKFLYIIDEEVLELKVIDLTVNDEIDSCDYNFWSIINKNIEKGKKIKF